MNEGDAVRAQSSLHEAQLALSDGQSQLIHLTGAVEARNGELRDDSFAVSCDAITLERVVEVYQWHEKEHKSSQRIPDGKGGELTETTVTYDYSEGWESREISSANFKHPHGHRNPRFDAALADASHAAKLDFSARSWNADAVMLGGLRLSPSLRSKASVSRDLDLSRDLAGSIERRLEDVASSARLVGGQYVYADRHCAGSSPRIGCVRARWTYAPLQVVSVLAKHAPLTRRRPTAASSSRSAGGDDDGGSLVEWPTSAGPGYDVALLEFGEHDALAMLSRAAASASLWTWLKRGGGTLLVWIGWGLLFGPAQYLASWIPLLGGLVGCALACVALAVALSHSLAVIAAAWLFQRPLLATAALVMCAVALALTTQSLRSWASFRLVERDSSSSTPMSSSFGRPKQM